MHIYNNTHRNTNITDFQLSTSIKIGNENVNGKEIGSLPLRALWFHFKNKMDYSTIR